MIRRWTSSIPPCSRRMRITSSPPTSTLPCYFLRKTRTPSININNSRSRVIIPLRKPSFMTLLCKPFKGHNTLALLASQVYTPVFVLAYLPLLQYVDRQKVVYPFHRQTSCIIADHVAFLCSSRHSLSPLILLLSSSWSLRLSHLPYIFFGCIATSRDGGHCPHHYMVVSVVLPHAKGFAVQAPQTVSISRSYPSLLSGILKNHFIVRLEPAKLGVIANPRVATLSCRCFVWRYDGTPSNLFYIR